MKICPKCGFPMDVCYTNGELEYYKCPRCVWVFKGDEEFVDYKVFAEWVAAKIVESISYLELIFVITAEQRWLSHRKERVMRNDRDMEKHTRV